MFTDDNNTKARKIRTVTAAKDVYNIFYIENV